jgi:hypothetical protein
MDRTEAASISFQQLSGAAERLAAREAAGLSLQDWLSHIEDARDRLARDPFVALPLAGHRVVTNAKERIVGTVPPPDRLVEECLVPILHDRLEKILAPGVHGFRPGRSTLTAAVAASAIVAAGGGFVSLLDIESRAEVETLRTRLSEAPDIPTLMGLEGAATKAYYRGFAARIRRPEFALTERTKRPPRDPINSLLSFSYSLIFGEMQTALLAHGLDPHPGLLHELRRGHPALASDLIEPYRPLIADSFVLLLVNGGIMQPSDFEEKGGGCYLTADGRRRLLHVFERQMNRRQGSAPGPRQMLQGAAQAMLQVVLGERQDLHLPLKTDELSDDDGGFTDARTDDNP